MATLYTDTATKQNAMTSAVEKMLNEQLGGRVRCARGSVTPGTEAAGTIINLVKLPKGARVLPQSRIYFAAGQGATMTVKVGDAADDDRYSVAAAPGVNATSILLDAAIHAPVPLAAEGWIFITTGVAALAAAAISFEILYVID